MKILLTGATGFVGSHTARTLLESGRHELALLVRPRSDTHRIRDLLLQTTIVAGDLSDLRSVRTAVKVFRPEAVVHLAWRGVVNSARNDVGQTANVRQALNLISLAQAAGARHWVGLGSQAEYGPCSNRITESMPTNPTTNYGRAKLAACRESAELCDRLGMSFSWLRLFSAYGPHDDPSWLIPYLALSLLRGERPKVTAGEQRWDYLYVDDVAAAVAVVAEHSQATGVFNLGSGTTSTVRSIIEQVRNLINPRLPVGFGEVPYRADQVMHLEADISRLAALGWRPRISLAEGLARTVAWCRETSARRLAA